MNLHVDDLIEGFKDILQLHKQGENIFDQTPSGAMFPNNTSQSMWQFAKGKNHLRLSDGTNVYHFNTQGNLDGDEDLEFTRAADVPLTDLHTDAIAKGKAQVHRSDPSSIYFTMQEGTRNPTYTLKHMGADRWKAIMKRKKVKASPVLNNVDVESFKQAMLKEAGTEAGGFFHDLNQMAGKGVMNSLNGLQRLALSPGEISMPSSLGGDRGQREWQFGDAATAAGLGAGAGALYHGLKRNFWNTPEENTEEDEQGGHLMRRMLVPGLGLGASNALMNNMGNTDYYQAAAQGNPYKLFGPSPGNAIK